MASNLRRNMYCVTYICTTPIAATITSTAMPSESECVWTHHILYTIVYGNQNGYTRHSFTLQWEIETMLDILAYAIGTLYLVGIVVFILVGVISGFGGWKR